MTVTDVVMASIVALVLAFLIYASNARPQIGPELLPGSPVAIPTGLPSAISPTHPSLSGRSGD